MNLALQGFLTLTLSQGEGLAFPSRLTHPRERNSRFGS